MNKAQKVFRVLSKVILGNRQSLPEQKIYSTEKLRENDCTRAHFCSCDVVGVTRANQKAPELSFGHGFHIYFIVQTIY